MAKYCRGLTFLQPNGGQHETPRLVLQQESQRIAKLQAIDQEGIHRLSPELDLCLGFLFVIALANRHLINF